LGGVWADLQVLFVGHYANALVAANRIDSSEYNSVAFRALPVAGDLPDAWGSAFMLLAFTIALAAIAFYVFERRDLGTTTE
jgi:hypothetical protein